MAEINDFALPDDPGYIRLYEGQLEITENKTGDAFLMNAGQMVTLNGDGTVGRPIPMKEKKSGGKN